MGVEMNQEEILCGYVGDFIDDKISEKEKVKFEQALAVNGGDAFIEKYNTYRGKLQASFRADKLTVEQRNNLYSHIEDPTARHTQEIAKINQIGKLEKETRIKRLLYLAAALILIGGLFIYQNLPSVRDGFKPLQYLSWEATSMINDPEKRLTLKSSDKSEISQMFSLDKSLSFTPRILSNFSSQYEIEGAKIVNYEGIPGITATQYQKSDGNRMVFFQYEGLLSELPSSEPGNMLGLVYQTYTTDDLNIIAWQEKSNVVGILAGFDSSQNLARYVNTGQ